MGDDLARLRLFSRNLVCSVEKYIQSVAEESGEKCPTADEPDTGRVFVEATVTLPEDEEV